jgi:hypothetical protein
MTPHEDRLRYDVDPEVLAAGGVNDLPAPTRHQHTLVSSLTVYGTHRPVLDLDGVGAALVPSSTEGNFHFYLEGIELPWEDYADFLRACAKVGIITEGYLAHSLRRRQTVVRRPGLRKTAEELNRSSEYDDFDFFNGSW